MQRIKKKFGMLFFLIPLFLILLPIDNSIQENNTFNFLEISSSVLTRSPVIVINSDSDYSTYASSGSGTFMDPWIIEDMLIECNYSYIGISIQNANDNVIFRNIFVNESGSGPNNATVIMLNSLNIIFDNCTFEEASGTNVAIIGSENIKFNDVIFRYSGGNNLYADGSRYITVNNSQLYNSSTVNFETGFALTTDTVNYTVIENTLLANATTRDILIRKGKNHEIYNTNITSISSSLLDQVSDTVLIQYCNITKILQLEDSVNIDISHNYLDILFLDNVTTISIINNTILDSGLNNGIEFAIGENVLIKDNLIIDSNTGLSLSFGSASNITIINNTVTNTTDNGIFLAGMNSGIFANNTLSNAASSNNYGLVITSTVHNIDFTNNTIENTISHDNIWLAASDNNFTNNRIINAHDAGLWIDSNVDNISIINNSFINNSNFQAILIYQNCDNITIESNNFTGNNFAIQLSGSGQTGINVSYNYFDSNSRIYDGLISPNFSYNYYRDYFDKFPYAITDINLTVLNETYVVTSSINDLTPLYYNNWYPRSDLLNVQFFSNFNNLGITFEIFKVFLNGLQLANKQFTVSNVLSRITVKDFADQTILDFIHNINSSHDLNLGMNVAEITWRNNGSVDVTLFIRQGNITTIYAIPSGDSFSLFMLIGTYEYWFESDTRTSNNFTVDVEQPDTINIGFIIEITEPEQVIALNVLDYLIIVAFLVPVIVLVFLGAFRQRLSSLGKKSTRKRKRTRMERVK